MSQPRTSCEDRFRLSRAVTCVCLVASTALVPAHAAGSGPGRAPGAALVRAATLLGGGGTSNEDASCVAADAFGNVYVVGTATLTDFPVTRGAYDRSANGRMDVILAKFNAQLTELLAATYLGGNDDDQGLGVAVDAAGRVFVTGYTTSSNFPATSGTYDPSKNGGFDVFVARFDSQLTTLQAATFLGGYAADYGKALALGADGLITVAGDSGSPDFPMLAGGFDTGMTGSRDGFVVRLDADLTTLVAATFLGGNSQDFINALAIGPSGDVFAAGTSWSTDFPTSAGTFDASHNGGTYDGVVVRLSADLTTLVGGTYLGGADVDMGQTLAVGPDETVFVALRTESADFPTTPGAFDRDLDDSGLPDAALCRLSPDFAVLEAATLLGGVDTDRAYALAVDAAGRLFAVGSTGSPDFPTTGPALGPTALGTFDAFVSHFDADLTTLDFSVRLGGDLGHDGLDDVLLEPGGTLLAFGHTQAADFPTTLGAYDIRLDGPQDFLVARLDFDLDGLCADRGDGDGDSLPDGWERCGYDHDGDGTVDVDLPAMGADPSRKDVFVEVDAMVDPGTCLAGLCLGGHDHRLADAARSLVETLFADAPVDAGAGIALHLDAGPDAPLTWGAASSWGPLSDGEPLPHSDTLVAPETVWDEALLAELRAAAVASGHFRPERAPIFHYALLAHDLGGDLVAGTSGISFGIPGAMFVTSLGQADGQVGSVGQQAGTFAHELGHNLGLGHGGAPGPDAQNYKPNYLSLMNYAFQFSGLLRDGEFGHYDYSRFGALPDLDEAQLDESVGLAGGPALVGYGTVYACPDGQGGFVRQWVADANGLIDWDCSGTIETVFAVDVNRNASALDRLTSHDDFAALGFSGAGSIGGGKRGVAPSQPAVGQFLDPAVPLSPYAVTLAGGGLVVGARGSSTTLPLTVRNRGSEAVTVQLAFAGGGSGWLDAGALPATVSLPPQAEATFPLPLTFPTTLTTLSERDVITATCLESPRMSDTATFDLRLGPFARFELHPATGHPPLAVTFTDFSAGAVTSWLWDFGDGTTSTEPAPVHEYAALGSYTVRLTVTGPDGSRVAERRRIVRVTEWACVQDGDVNVDGYVSAGDAQQAFLVTLGLTTLNPSEQCAADCDGDGTVTAGDASAIFAYALGAGAPCVGAARRP